MLACSWIMEPNTQKNHISEYFLLILFPSLFFTDLGSQKWAKAGKRIKSSGSCVRGTTCLLSYCVGSTYRITQKAP